MPAPSQRKYDIENAKRIELYAKRVRYAYLNTIRQIAKLTRTLKLNSSNEFFFRNHKKVNEKVNILLKELYSNVYGTTVSGIHSEWDLAVEKNNKLAQYVYGKDLDQLSTSFKSEVFSNNAGARRAFASRKVNGLNLSDRVWNNTLQFKKELELALELGLGKGKSAQSLARSITGFLNEPDKLFRRVRSNQSQINSKLIDLKLLKDNDAPLRDIRKIENDISKLRSKGILRLSKAGKSFSPGRGRYRSSYKNALRVTRNEINFSYEGSQKEKRSQQDFIVAIKISVVPSHNTSDDKGGICCLCLQGLYPKNFDFTYKWHVNCKCQTFNVLKTRKELDKDLDLILAGKKPNTLSKKQVNKKPAAYKNYIKDNKKMWSKWKNPPRFIVIN